MSPEWQIRDREKRKAPLKGKAPHCVMRIMPFLHIFARCTCASLLLCGTLLFIYLFTCLCRFESPYSSFYLVFFQYISLVLSKNNLDSCWQGTKDYTVPAKLNTFCKIYCNFPLQQIKINITFCFFFLQKIYMYFFEMNGNFPPW